MRVFLKTHPYLKGRLRLCHFLGALLSDIAERAMQQQRQIREITGKRNRFSFKYLICFFPPFYCNYTEFQREINVFLLMLSCFLCSPPLPSSPFTGLSRRRFFNPALSHQSKQVCMSHRPAATWFSFVSLSARLSASTSVFRRLFFLAQAFLPFYPLLKMIRRKHRERAAFQRAQTVVIF